MSGASTSKTSETATLGAGCFWCVEAVLAQVEGVLEVCPGYMGGSVERPTYEQVCTGRSGHAEVVQVRFDPARLPYRELVDWFFDLHDPTTKDRQGEDVGPQYRSVIFVHSEEQRRIAAEVRAARERSGRHADPIVTEIAPAGPFWPAEAYHNDYYRQNRAKPYCRLVIAPKLRKLGLET
jgi:peptide-methionine (S)-S-oxide reductase